MSCLQCHLDQNAKPYFTIHSGLQRRYAVLYAALAGHLLHSPSIYHPFSCSAQPSPQFNHCLHSLFVSSLMPSDQPTHTGPPSHHSPSKG